MQRIASKLFVYVLALALFAAVLMLCVYMAKSQNEVPAGFVFGLGGGIYTILVLYILHRRAGTLTASPEERRRASEGEAEPMDI